MTQHVHADSGCKIQETVSLLVEQVHPLAAREFKISTGVSRHDSREHGALVFKCLWHFLPSGFDFIARPENGVAGGH